MLQDEDNFSKGRGFEKKKRDGKINHERRARLDLVWER